MYANTHTQSQCKKKHTAFTLKGIRESLFWNHFEWPWPGNIDLGCPKFHGSGGPKVSMQGHELEGRKEVVLQQNYNDGQTTVPKRENCDPKNRWCRSEVTLMERDDVDREKWWRGTQRWEEYVDGALCHSLPCWTPSVYFLFVLSAVSLPQCLPIPLLTLLRWLLLPKVLKPVSASRQPCTPHLGSPVGWPLPCSSGLSPSCLFAASINPILDLAQVSLRPGSVEGPMPHQTIQRNHIFIYCQNDFQLNFSEAIQWLKGRLLSSMLCPSTLSYTTHALYKPWGFSHCETGIIFRLFIFNCVYLCAWAHVCPRLEGLGLHLELQVVTAAQCGCRKPNSGLLLAQDSL